MALNIQIKEPTTEVILPVSGEKVLVKPMTMKIKKAIGVSQINTFSERLKFISQVLWDRVANKEVFNNSYFEFIKKIYIDDMEMLTYGMLVGTFKEPIEVTVICPGCGESMVRKVNIENSILELNINLDKVDIKEEYKRTIEFPDYGIVVTARPFSVAELQAALEVFESMDIRNLADSVAIDNISAMMYNMAEASVAVMIESITDENGNTETFDVLTNRNKFKNLIEFIDSLPDDIITKISDILNNIPYKVRFGIKSTCDNKECEYHNKPAELEISYTTLFFPQVAI